LKTAATQFEAMFINMMMKSMRDATPQEGMLDNQQTKMFTSMLDQQTSQNLAKRGIGLADVLIRQLGAQAVNAQALAIGGDQNMPTSDAMPAPRNADALLKTPGALLAPSALPARAQAPRARVPGKLGAHAGRPATKPGSSQGSCWGALESNGANARSGRPTAPPAQPVHQADPGLERRYYGATEYVNGVPQTRGKPRLRFAPRQLPRITPG
jgi:flagellar protein FlgJ